MQSFIHFSVFIVHIGAPALKAISIPFSCFIVTSKKGNDKMMLFHRNAPCFCLRRNLQRKFINRSDEVNILLLRPCSNWPAFIFLFRNGDRAVASIRKAIRAIPSSKGIKSFLHSTMSSSFYLFTDPANSPYRWRMSRHISFCNRTCSS